MAARSKARKRALDVLYEADMRGQEPVPVLAARLALADPPVPEYAVELVEGVTAHRAAIDRLLVEHSDGWTLERMPAVDRNVLRLGAYELLWCPGVPDAVAIDEAVQLAASLSTEESAGFVNGLLARLKQVGPPAEPEPTATAVDSAPSTLGGDGVADETDGSAGVAKGPTGLGGQHAPVDELLGESRG